MFLLYSLFISIAWLLLIAYLLINFRKIKQLNVQPISNKEPALVIIIAVRNEEDDLAAALQSVCNIKYANYRILVVNDRSTDRTADILKDFTFRYKQLTVTTITELPDGWLGKNNALYQGYLNSTEEWILFTDADIVFHPDAINKAIGYAIRHRLDHLAISPDTRSRSVVLNSVLATFYLMLMLYMRPWNAKNPKSKASVGIGAFNLVKRDAYEKAGTHTAIKLRPDDDLKLGNLIKSAGLRQDILSGRQYICLEWYKNLQQFINGLMKNSFSVADYKLGIAILQAVAVLICIALPIPIMLIGGCGYIFILPTLILLGQVTYMIMVPANKWWYALMIPFAGFLMAYIILKAAILTIKQGGIYWRDSFYSLATLKGKV
ncbi:glycosyltransferase family 2 protein [Mucilaginibacter sp.]|uniref:glycosyltransferase n=1 Tax=Mucilaginibacter sp. TaxID=1882438 RepID=UPI002636E7FB|nr:glycosyltransferase family 2 protein [Mucilaginibacter sp.]